MSPEDWPKPPIRPEEGVEGAWELKDVVPPAPQAVDASSLRRHVAGTDY